LEKLASLVDKAAVRAGCEAERRAFHPHITIARARAENGFGVTRELASRLSEAPLVSWECRGFTLARSVLAPGGAIYSTLGSYPG
jgi:2'-5' RNA ligase